MESSTPFDLCFSLFEPLKLTELPCCLTGARFPRTSEAHEPRFKPQETLTWTCLTISPSKCRGGSRVLGWKEELTCSRIATLEFRAG